MSRPAKITLTPIVEGDTWDGLTISWASDGTAFADSLTSVVMEFKTPQDTVALSLTSEDGDITIDDANTWEITVLPTILPLTSGVWKCPITTTDAEEVIKTRIFAELTIIDK
jgi:hypothetical protein